MLTPYIILQNHERIGALLSEDKVSFSYSYLFLIVIRKDKHFSRMHQSILMEFL